MNKIHNEQQYRLNDMIRTFLVIFIAVILSDVTSGEINWFWNLVMLGAITALCLFKIVIPVKRKILAAIRQALFA